MARVDLQLSRALSRLKDKGQHNTQSDEILSEMNQVQIDLCRDYYALKVKFNLTLVANQATYDLSAIDLITGNTYQNIFKVQESIEPTAWRQRITWIHDSSLWAKIIRDTRITGTPRYGFTWKKTITLYPTPTSVDTITIIGYALPLNDLTFGSDPEIDQEWDEALMLGACKNIAGGDFYILYKEEAEKVLQQRIKESINGVQLIDYGSTSSIWNNGHRRNSNYWDDGKAWWD